jgi:hypothetical protein
MKRTVAVALAAALALAGLVAWPGDAAKKKPQLKLVYGLGPEVNVAPQEAAENSAACPRGYYVTGGGLFLGAIEAIADGPSADGRAWEAIGGNPSTTETFSYVVTAVCARGQKGLKIKKAVSKKALRRAERDWLRAHGH